MACWQEDGSLEYMGRIDQQVKIRGHRIEIGEIESMLLRHPAIQEAAVTALRRGGHTELCAYVVASGQAPVSDLRDYLAAKLPDYMIPSHVVPLEHIPLTPNGKLDRKALPAPADRVRSARDAALPRTELERLIAEAWQAVLELESVSIHDKYFEVGGNSINLIQLQSKLQRQLKREVPIVTLFQYPTVHELAAYLAGKRTGHGTGPASRQRQAVRMSRIPSLPPVRQGQE